MYDISQLNELLVPELLDIADELNIPNSKKLNKQDLIKTILDKQANMKSDSKTPGGEKPKRKRILKSDAPADASTKDAAPEKDEAHKRDAHAQKGKKAEPEKNFFLVLQRCRNNADRSVKNDLKRKQSKK